ncbi:MAG: STAS domain-containing protein [Byssovorax sp.]
MHLEELKLGNITILSPRDPRIDRRRASDLKETVARLVEHDQRRIIVDLTRVAFIDSAGIGALLSGLKQAGPGGELALAAPREAVSTQLRLTHLDRIFRSYPSVRAAVRALSQARPARGVEEP